MRRVAFLGLSVLLVLGGCDSSTAVEDDYELTAEQADWVAEMVAGVGTAGVNGGASGHAAPLRSPEPIAIFQPVDYRHTCNVSGNIHVSGNVSGSISDTGTGLVLIGVTETLSSCRSRTSGGGWFELNGDPYLSLAGTFSFLNGVPSTQQSMTIGGAFRWVFDTGQNGSCSLQLTVLFNGVTGGGTLSGAVCGHAVSGAIG